MPTTRTYVIARFTDHFKCDEYLSTTGYDFTLHLDKAETYDTLAEAYKQISAMNAGTVKDYWGDSMAGCWIKPARRTTEEPQGATR